MKRYNKSEMRIRKRRFRRIGIVVLLFLNIGIFYRSWHLLPGQKAAAGNLDKTRAEKEKLLKRRDELKENLRRLNSKRGEEMELRRKFNVIKEGEQVIVIQDNPDIDKPINTEKVKEKRPRWPWQKGKNNKNLKENKYK